MLRGALAFFTFDDAGASSSASRSAPVARCSAWTSSPASTTRFLALEPDTVVFEVKSGPTCRAATRPSRSGRRAKARTTPGSYLAWLKAVFNQRSSTKSA